MFGVVFFFCFFSVADGLICSMRRVARRNQSVHSLTHFYRYGNKLLVTAELSTLISVKVFS